MNRQPDLDFSGRSTLVTGGAGFVGSHLVEALLEAGATVRVVDDFSTGKRENLKDLTPVELIEESVIDLESMKTACEGVDFVFHQAALPSVARSLADPIATHEAAATGTLNVLHAARQAGVDRVIYAASSSAYGDTRTLPKREDMPSSPRSPYAVAKLAGELYCRAFSNSFHFPAVALRYFNIFGPRQDPHSPYGAVIPIFIQAALDGPPHGSKETDYRPATSPILTTPYRPI